MKEGKKIKLTIDNMKSELMKAFQDMSMADMVKLWHEAQAVKPKPPRKIIVAGGRDFDNYEWVERDLDNLTLNYDWSEVEIVSGGARGADRLGEQYAKTRGCKLTKFPADWDKHGKSAGFIRNKQMAEYGTHLMAYWDGKSRGTKNMIEEAQKLDLEWQISYY
jgi:hypothetical protein